MEHKKTASKAKSPAKSDHKTTPSHAKSGTAKASTPKTTTPKASAADRNYTVISNEPEDMAVLSDTQRTEIFDMSASENPASDSQAAQDARVQGALEPVGTAAAIEPIVTEDGVITPYSR